MADMVNSLGRLAVFVNESLLTTPLSSQVENGVLDRLRNLLRRYYTAKEEGIIRYEAGFENPSFMTAQIIDSDPNRDPFLQFKFLQLPSGEQGDDLYLLAMKSLAVLIDSTSTFEDFYFKRPFPVRSSLMQKVNKVGTVQYLKPESVYNFLVPTYEKLLLEQPTLSENLLPSFYAMYAQTVYKQTNFEVLNNTHHMSALPQFSMQHHEIGEEFLSVLGSSEENIRDRYSKYWKKYAEVINYRFKSSSDFNKNSLETIPNEYKTYVFTDSAIPLLTTEAIKGEMFPFYNSIKFSTDKNTAFANILADLKMSTELIKYIAKTPPMEMKCGKSMQKYTPSSLEDEPPSESYDFEATTMKRWDVKKWITDGVFNVDFVSARLVGSDVRGQYSYWARDIGTPNSSKEVQKVFTKLIMSAKINRFSKNNFRTLKEMWDGKASYSEVVFYRIQKYGANQSQEQNIPITTYYIPNSSQLDVCNFIDTQVKYGKSYRYQIDAYVLVLGTSYSYNSWGDPKKARQEQQINIGMGTTPSLKIVEVPIDNIGDLMVLDNPPMPPESSIIPYRDVDNKILINMNGSTGDRVLKPVLIEGSDAERVRLQKLAQRRGDGKLRFKSDDAPALFQIFRTTRKPRSYSDFSGKIIKQVSTNNISTSAAVHDQIRPNIKYYYILRSVDIHDNISNPSPIYEVEMRHGEGTAPYLIIKIVDLDMGGSKDKKPSKSMKRYVQILPTTSQGLLNVPASNLTDIGTVKGQGPFVLGVADEGLWGKKFRIRFTSKKTGRKIDLDIKFAVEHQLKES